MTIINTSEAIYITALPVAVSYICQKMTSTRDMGRLPYEYNWGWVTQAIFEPCKGDLQQKIN